MAALGEALNCYWSQKKHIAPGCEPPAFKIFMDHMSAFVLGQSLAGAGGILTNQLFYKTYPSLFTFHCTRRRILFCNFKGSWRSGALQGFRKSIPRK